MVSALRNAAEDFVCYVVSLLSLAVQMEAAGIELRTRIAGGARRPLVALSAGGLTGTLEGDEVSRATFWRWCWL